MRRAGSVGFGVLVLALAAACTTTPPPSRLDTYLCGDELIAIERGAPPPVASCVPVAKWPRRRMPGGPPVRCGARLNLDEVTVVEVADLAQVRDPFIDASGRYDLESEGWFGLDERSTKVVAEQEAQRLAAATGCPLLVLGPRLVLELRDGSYERGRVSVVRYRLFRLGRPAVRETSSRQP